MIDAFFSALSGMRTASNRLQVSANNTSNLQTPGFKKSRAVITDVAQGGSLLAGVNRSNTPGSLIPTGNSLDLAIEGKGFFQVNQNGGGTAFTRAGSLRIDSDGRLVNGTGNPLQPEISVPLNAESLTVTNTGQVSATINGQPVTLGQIQLADFTNPNGLTSLGNNLFGQSAQSGQPVAGNPGSGGLGMIVGSSIETSNVDIAEEAVEQIISKVAFTANANVIRTATEMTGTLLDIKA